MTDNWQPIETAPKDGAVVDLWVRPSYTGTAHRRTNMWWIETKSWTGWRGGKFHLAEPYMPVGDFIPSNAKVTHWMPLPDPPVDLAERVKEGEE